MAEIYGRAENENYELIVEYDEFADNPRDDDNLGIMYCWHGRYKMGDEHNFSEPKDFLRSLVNESFKFTEEQIENMSFNRLHSLIEQKYVIHPIYMYEHSGRSFSLSPFGDRWDSGMIGYMFASKEKIREDQLVKKVTKKISRKVEEIFKSELKVYEYWAEGEVYRLIIRDKRTGETIDDVGGFYGISKFESNGMKEYLNEEQKELLEEII